MKIWVDISIHNHCLTGSYNFCVFKVKRGAAVVRNKVQEEKKTINLADVDTNSLTILLFNARSLKRHALDITNIKHLTGNDILYLMESQMSISRVFTDIVHGLHTF